MTYFAKNKEAADNGLQFWRDSEPDSGYVKIRSLGQDVFIPKDGNVSPLFFDGKASNYSEEHLQATLDAFCDAAAEQVRYNAMEQAQSVDDCDGENFAALADVVGDAEFSQSKTVDFVASYQDLLAQLSAALDFIQRETEQRELAGTDTDYYKEAKTLQDNIEKVLTK